MIKKYLMLIDLTIIQNFSILNELSMFLIHVKNEQDQSLSKSQELGITQDFTQFLDWLNPGMVLFKTPHICLVII
ncbi:unnamed protein product [Paramecium pentaurelia]|uniref:Uncharacterized protein n=1 Tax=Paramecium pentaurelia TaxID=43138 RepID=A0A8S1V3V3_9CILI|nr:unnamed protein product [Paramecium pentaurelia]